MKIIDFEAHYYSKALLDRMSRRTSYPYYDAKNGIIYNDAAGFPFKELVGVLMELSEDRLRKMDAAGVEKAILSGSYGAEQLEPDVGYEAAREMNDTMRSVMDRHPDRFGAYAVIAVNNVEEGLRELERCKEMGFFGWNAFSNYGDTMLDDERYLPLLRKAAELDMPVYIHPATPQIKELQGRGPILATKGVGFGIDVTVAFYRLMFSGIFDICPNLKILVGHLGEGMPYYLERTNAAYLKFPGFPKQSPEYYFKNNVWVTTSGTYSAPAMRCACDVLGEDRILFGSDYPYEEDMADAVRFVYDSCDENRAERIFGGNASVFGL